MNDSKSIQKAIERLNRSGGNIIVKAEQFVEKMVDKGVEFAKNDVPVYTGELRESISGEVTKTESKIEGVISTDCDYAKYVEFGTGVVGQGSYPSNFINDSNWQYDINNHGDAGWVYWNPNDGKAHRTAGHRANPFMYNTSRHLEDIAPIIAKEVANDK